MVLSLFEIVQIRKFVLMEMFRHKSIRRKLTLWFLIIGLFPLALGILIPFIQKVGLVRDNCSQKLVAVRDLKAEQLESWIRERQTTLQVLSADNDISQVGYLYDNQAQTTNVRVVYNDIKNKLNTYLGNYKDISEIFIINPQNGKIILSTDLSSLGEDRSNDTYFKKPLNSNEPFIKDVYFDNKMQKNTMAFAFPVSSKIQTSRNSIVGILVATIDLQNSMYVMLQDKTGLGKTGEVVIVNKDVIALNDLLNFKNAPLNLRIKAEPAIRASKGETGIVETKDYNNTKVLAAYTSIQPLGWGFVTKQNTEEIYEPIRTMLINYAILFLISLILLVIVASLVAKSISRPIIKMAEVSERIEKGELSARNEEISKDEVGYLAGSFNKMAEVISSKLEIQEKVSRVSSTMMEIIDMKEFGNKLLKKLMDITEAHMGVFYVLDQAKGEYNHFTSIGANQNLLKSFDAKNPEGEFGIILSDKKLNHIKDIPVDTAFNFRTSTKDVNAREIITLPILVEDSVVAIISLASISSFNKNSIEVLSQSSININTAYSHILATEKTRSMAEHLSKVNEQLEEQTKEILNKSEELQRYTIELNKQNQELDAQRIQVEEANRLKSEFVSNMSHELRTPLNSIMALSRVLIMKSQDRLSDEEQEYLKIVERNGKQLLSLINDILDLSKIEAGKLDLNVSKINIGSLLTTIKENLNQLAIDKGLKVSLQVAEDLPMVETDLKKLHQVFQNIVGNAIKFTDKGEVKIVGRLNENKDVEIIVKDTGIGIPEKEIPLIFEEFRQVDGTTSRKFEGTGLGLAIAKKTIKILGGTIDATSQLGVGSSFIVTIPQDFKQEVKPRQVTYYKPSSKESGKKTILIVDDDPEIIEEVSGFVTEAGFEPIKASSGQEAIELAEKYQPSLITLDIIMPEMDGWEVLQQLKKSRNTKHIPVIVVSVSDDLKTGIALGAFGHIFKPIDKTKLINKINNVFRTSSSLLLVDDNDLDLQLMAYKLKSEKWKVNTASGGKECIKLLEDNVPDVLILDLLMPEVDGFQVLEHIRSQENTKDLPVIIITAKNLTEQDRKLLEGRVSRVLVKSQTSLFDLHSEINRIIAELTSEQNKESVKESESKDKIAVDNKKEGSSIVIVKSKESNIEEISFILNKEGYKLNVVNSVEPNIKEYSPHVIILSVEQPELGNFEALEKLQSNDELKDIPVLIITKSEIHNQSISGFSTQYLQYSKYDASFPFGITKKLELLIKKTSNIVKPELEEVGTDQDWMEEEITSVEPTKTEQIIEEALPEIEGGKILVVEDNPDNRVTISAILKDTYDIIEATNGIEGLKKAQTLSPDIILMDISLPLMDGLEVTKFLKSKEETKNIPIVVVTAHAMKHDREVCLESGCDDYVTKPIDPEELVSKIKRALAKKR